MDKREKRQLWLDNQTKKLKEPKKKVKKTTAPKAEEEE